MKNFAVKKNTDSAVVNLDLTILGGNKKRY